jgi:hypothetical protein
MCETGGRVVQQIEVAVRRYDCHYSSKFDIFANNPVSALNISEQFDK